MKANPVFEGSRYLLIRTKKIQSIVKLLDLTAIAKVFSPHLDLSLVQPRLLHDALDVTGSEHEVGLAGEHGTLETQNTLFWKTWHGGWFRAWRLMVLPFINKKGAAPSSSHIAGGSSGRSRYSFQNQES